MKITFVTDTYVPQPNGVATTLHRLVEGMREFGHHVDIIRPAALKCDDEGLEIPSIALPKYPEVRIGLPMRLRLQARWYRNPPNVIYVATETPLGASAISAARALNIPVATGFHTNFQQYMAHYRLPLLERATIPYLRYLHNRSTSTFVPSIDMMDRLVGLGFRNLSLLPRGVDTGLFSPKKRDEVLRREWGASESGFVGLFVGRIAAEKNLPLVVKTYQAIRAKHPDFTGVFVGNGPKLETLRKEHPEFIYTDVQRGEDLARCYASADILVFPSLTETFGNVTLEGMASGLAVIAFDYAAARQHIKDGTTGYSAPFGEEEQYMNRALGILSDMHLPDIRKAARTRAREVSWKQVIQRFESELVDMIVRVRTGRTSICPINQLDAWKAAPPQSRTDALIKTLEKEIPV